MPREIRIPRRVLSQVHDEDGPGLALLYPVVVDWPELQLTEGQIVANSLALASGQPAPYPDLSIITVRLER